MKIEIKTESHQFPLDLYLRSKVTNVKKMAKVQKCIRRPQTINEKREPKGVTALERPVAKQLSLGVHQPHTCPTKSCNFSGLI